MRFKPAVDANHTCWQGEFPATYYQLVDAFGFPDYGPDDPGADKVTCNWSLKFEDGTVATIYDWKTGSTPMGFYHWHIGGHSKAAVARVLEVWDEYRRATA